MCDHRRGGHQPGRAEPHPPRARHERPPDVQDGVLPTTLEAGGEVELIPTKARDFFQGPDDIYELIYTGGTGLGDPLDRETDAVAHDVSETATSVGAAREYYGVALTQAGPYDWRVDVGKTERLRRDRRAARLELPVFDGSMPDAGQIEDGQPFVCLLLNLGMAEHAGGHACFCTWCRGVVCGSAENYKNHSRFEEVALSAANPYFIPARTFLDTAFVARRYFCLSCGALFDLEACESGAEPFRDVTLEHA